MSSLKDFKIGGFHNRDQTMRPDSALDIRVEGLNIFEWVERYNNLCSEYNKLERKYESKAR